MFGDPFDTQLIAAITPLIKEALGRGRKLHENKTVVCMEGPQFSTRAESLMYRTWGGDVINMSVLPEAKLAREAEVRYETLSPDGKMETHSYSLLLATLLSQRRLTTMHGA